MRSIRDAWERSGLTQAEFAARAGFSARTLRRYINAKSVPMVRRRTISYVSFAATHTQKQVTRRNQRVRATAIRQAEVNKARQDESPIVFHRLNGERVTVTGRKAGTIRAAYVRANQNRARLGQPSISSRGYYGDPDKLPGILRRSHSLKALRHRQSAGREGFKKSIKTGLQYANVLPEDIEAVMNKLDSMSDDKVDELYRKAVQESWDIITSPVDEDTKMPKVPDVSGLFAWLGMSRTRLNIRL